MDQFFNRKWVLGIGILNNYCVCCESYNINCNILHYGSISLHGTVPGIGTAHNCWFSCFIGTMVMYPTTGISKPMTQQSIINHSNFIVI